MRNRLSVAAVAVALLAAGCGGGDDEQPSEPAGGGGGGGGDGQQLFSDNCESCHGIEGAGGHIGPNLQTSPVAENLSRVEQQVRNGGGAMPAFSGQLSDAEIAAVAHYVVAELAPKG